MNEPHVSNELREWRRHRAWELKQAGWQQKEIAAALGVSEGAVSQWMRRVQEAGAAGLATRPRSGRPPKLTDAQKAQLPALLARGAEAYGFRGQVWTAGRVGAVIHQTFHVQYSRDYVSTILRSVGWSVQQPIERATQRDAAAIAAWWEDRWPAIKKKPTSKGTPLSS